LDQAGWMPEADGIRAKGGRKLALIGICPPDMQQAMTLLQAQLKEVGIDMSVQPGSASQVYNILQSPGGSYNAAWPIRAGWTNEDPYLMYSHNNSKNMPPNGMSNYSKVSVPEMARLVKRGAAP